MMIRGQICTYCGKEFENTKRHKYCSFECSLADQKKKYKKDFVKRFNLQYPALEYLSGYDHSDGNITYRCKQCGEVKTCSAQAVRKKYLLECKECRRIKKEKEEKLKKAIIEKERDMLRVKRLKERQITRACAECGKVFITTKKNVICCSKECSKKRSNNHKDRRLKKCDIVDYSITLTKLVKRDNGVCHICGQRVDMRADGNSEWYGSIDHVKPISKGGNHVWGNVKLAHRRCNTVKRDNIIYEADNGQITMAI